MIQLRAQPILPFVILAIGLWIVRSGTAAVPDWHYANWQVQDGLPSNKIMAALQTRDGYIWAGTYEGLVRFDGVSFTRFDAARAPGMVDSSVTALLEDREGALWIGHGSGAVTRYRDGQFTFYGVAPERKGTRVQNLASDDAGDVWSLDVAGHLVRVRDGRVLVPEGGESRGIFSMVSSRQGEVWINARGKLSLLQHGELRVVPWLPGMDEYIQGMCPSATGKLWVIAGGRLWQLDGRTWSDAFGVVATGSRPVFTLAELHDGRLVGGTFEVGALIVDSMAPLRQRSLGRANGFPSDWITATFEDHEGSIWLATGTAGLFRLGAEKIQMLLPPDGLQGRAALSVTALNNGELWVGTEGSGVYRCTDGNWTAYTQHDGVDNLYVWSVSHDADGRVWAGTWGSGIMRLDDNRFARHPGRVGADTGVAALLPSRRGGMLVGTLQGILRCDAQSAEWVETGGNRRLKNVRALLEDEDGTIWAGCHGEGLGCIRGSAVTQLTHRDGLSSDYVDCLYRDRVGALWIGTHGGGLNRYQAGHFSVVSSANGLGDNCIGDIEEDDLGYFWLSSKAGILRVSAAELNACADGTLSRIACGGYGLSDGMATLSCSGSVQPAGCRLPDGRLAFATDRGVAVVNPKAVAFNRVPPPVWIESAKVGDHVLFSGATPRAPLEIGPGESRIEIRYTGVSFAAPEKVAFRRQLEPLESTPSYVGTERVAVYNYVPPGRYTFRVTAANNDGVWNDTGQSLALIIRPYFWQTVWFKLLLVGLLIAATAAFAWFSSRRRMQRRLERIERERAIERERTRIANDMHDDLGAHLTRITMLSETAQRDVGDPARLNEGLRQIYETAGSVTRGMDEIVWAVNPKHDTLESLVSYFEKFAVDFVGAAGMRCRLDMPLECPAWSPSSEVRHNLFLCLKEALNNAVRHSGADIVTVSIHIAESSFRVAVADNGRGLPATVAAEPREPGRIAAGNGLGNLHVRMARIGGTCEVGNAAGGGCIVTFVVPMPPRSTATPIHGWS